jgi:outer membrane protein
MTLLYLCFAGAAAHAADLIEAWHAARTYDAGLMASQAALRAAEEKVAQGDALLASRVDVTANAGQADRDYRPGVVSAAHPGAYTSGQGYGAAVVWSKPLYDAGASFARDRLHREAEQARILYQQAEQDLMLRVARSYFDVLLARENVAQASAQEQAINERLGLARQSYELGLTSASDTDDAQARYDSIVATQVANANDLANKADTFEVLTGLDPERLAPISPEFVATPPPQTNLGAWIDRARSGNTTIRQLELGVEIAELSIGQYRWSGAPVVSAVASVGRQYDAGSISTSGGRDATTSGSVGLRMVIPLFDGGSLQSLLRQSLALEDQQRDALEAGVREAQRATRQFFGSVRDGAQRIRALERARVSGESSVRSSKVGQEVGVRTIIDVLNAEQSYYQTLYNLTSARCDYLYAQLQLAASAGALDDAALAQVNGALGQTQ